MPQEPPRDRRRLDERQMIAEGDCADTGVASQIAQRAGKPRLNPIGCAAPTGCNAALPLATDNFLA